MNKDIYNNFNNFNHNIYLKLNPDLNQSMNKQECIKHYLNIGIRENRKYKILLPSDFNPKNYIKLNSDLSPKIINNNINIINHYINIGYFENRKYKFDLPSDFNYLLYKEINNLNNNLSKENCELHYIKIGYFNNLKYKLDIPSNENLNNQIELTNKVTTNDLSINEVSTTDLSINEITTNDLSINEVSITDLSITKSQINNFNKSYTKNVEKSHTKNDDKTQINNFNKLTTNNFNKSQINNFNKLTTKNDDKSHTNNFDKSHTNLSRSRINNSVENEYKLLLPDIKKSKILIIYAYYEIKNQQKNQTNLSFFIRHGLNNKNWLNLNITSLFVINDFKTEVFIPNEINFEILRENNCSDFDAWYNGIRYLEKKYNKKITNIYDYIFFMNSGTVGPFMKPDINDHWLIPFYNKMIDNNSPICSTCISFLPKTDAGGPGPRIVSYNFFIRIDSKIYNLLFNTYLINISPESTNKNTTLFKNTIISKKISKEDAILTGEYGISRILIANGYNLSCLLYDNIDYNDKQNWNLNNNLPPDRYMSHFEKELPIEKILFIKNIWKHKDKKLCLPVQNNETDDLINLYSNFNKITFSNLNYNDLQVESTGININDNSNNWNNKKEFYNLYGNAEEYIIFPTKTIDNKGIVIYFYYDNENILRDFAIIALKSLIQVGYDIYFCTTCSKLHNIDDLPFKVHYFKNYGQGSEMIYWLKVLKIKYVIFKEKYEWVMLVNETVLFPINGLENFTNVINDMRSKSDFWGHWESYENNHHLISSFIEYNIKTIPDLINFYNIKLSTKNKTRGYYILEIETKQTLYLINKGYKYASVIPYDSLIFNKNLICPIFNPEIMYQWINRPETFAIKWKYMNNFINPQKFNNPIFNWITKYIHFGPNGPKGAPEVSNTYKNPQQYY